MLFIFRNVAQGFKSLVLLIIFSSAMSAHAAPTGGQVTAGTGSISQSGATTTITQQSQNLSMNWDKFNIAPKETVNFAQPGRNAIAVNRVLGSHQASQIQGHLNANGQVWLINPNGVVFTKGSTVNVGGLLASTLNVADSELSKAQREFSGSGKGSIINQGKIQTVKGGYVALLANTVSNQGSIITPQGTTALAAGSQFTVTFAEHQLTAIRVDKSTLNNLVENKQVIRANGGHVIMTAGARDSLLSSAVNNTGIIEAQTIGKHHGSIVLLGGVAAGTTTVSGELNASAPRGGKGGEIETSAAQVKIAPKVKITTQSSDGMAGFWTIDPQDYTIAASGGDITGAQITTLLGTNNIIISSDQGQTTGTGNLNVNDAISWANANSLTLNAVNSVIFTAGTITNTGAGTLNVRADVNGTGTGTITLNAGSTVTSSAGGAVNFYYNAPTNATAFLPATFTGVTVSNGALFRPYMLVFTPQQFAKIPTSPNNSTQYNYALSANINMTGVAGFTPINTSNNAGSLDGQNFTVSNLTITGNNNVGLFNTIQTLATVKNLTLSAVNISGASTVGALAGTNNGTVSNITVSGTVNATGTVVGGMLGQTNTASTGTNLSSSVNVTSSGGSGGGNANTGGLIGSINGGTYSYATVTGSVTVAQSTYQTGGFAGFSNGNVSNASFTGTLTTPAAGKVGGLIGVTGTASVVAYSNSTASINAGNFNFDDNGGFIGINAGSIDSCYSTGNLVLQQSWRSSPFVGNNSGNISNSYTTGNLISKAGPVGGGGGTPVSYNGGFVGINNSGILSNDYTTANMTINANLPNSTQGSNYLGGFVGSLNGGSITHSYASGNVSSVAPNAIGAFAGYSNAPMTYVYASGSVTALNVAGGSTPTNIGGLIGQFAGSTLSQGYSVGNVSAAAGSTNVGGLIGQGGGTISGRSFWDTTTSGISTPSVVTNAVGMPTAAMQTQANFTSATAANGNVNPNWNFSPATPVIWKMGTGGYLYPVFSTPNSPNPPPPPPTPPVLYYPLTVPNLMTATKVYDATTAATLTGTLSGVLPNDNASITLPITGAFNDKNVGNAKPVTVNTPTLSGANASKYLLVPLSTTGTITPLTIQAQVNGTAADKVYDATTTATGITLQPIGILPADIGTVNLTSTAANFDNKNVGNNKVVTVSGITTGTTGNGPNYVISTSTITTTGNITPRPLQVTATGMNKTYDGTVAANVNVVGSTDPNFNILPNDMVSLAATGSTFANKNANPMGTAITIGPITPGGTDASNYMIINPPTTTTAVISAKPITVTAVGQNRMYDGTTTATVNLDSSGKITGDDINFTNTSANFDTKNVDNGKPIMVNGITAMGNDVGNYIISNPNTTAAGDITPRILTATAATDPTKVYDGTTATSVTLTPNNVVSGDVVNLTSSTANFDNKNVGTAKPVAVDGVGIVPSPGSGNYAIASTVTVQGSITPKPITLTGTGNDKVYDGTTAATLTITSPGLIANDNVQFIPAAANFDNKNVGNGKPITATGITAGGPDGNNYTVTNPDLNNLTANITPKPINVTATGNDKVVDGSTAVTVDLGSAGRIPGDALNFDYGAATAGTASPGLRIPVNVTGISASGADAGNYFVTNTTATTTVNIFPRFVPPPPEVVFIVNNQIPLQSILAALQQPQIGILIGNPYWNDNDARKDRTYEPLNLFVRGRGIRLPNRNRVLGGIL